jgi:hypothetical protein
MLITNGSKEQNLSNFGVEISLEIPLDYAGNQQVRSSSKVQLIDHFLSNQSEVSTSV